jgi:hypothetical protein
MSKEYDDAVDLEIRPGRKHTRKERAALLGDIRKIFQHGDEREFMKFLREHAIPDEDPRFSELVKLFRASRSAKP